ncbi:3-methyl-2-oxobutanoate hydroxymethyltransferase [Acinetobacter guillouiae]|uniref:3-methyl-2-oxobutanoate hydroxymethyltransferase n=1 Tax=Acinetobacter guillouiae TaxID=106649 RepID=UPI0021D37B7C|nr:3-methyl-2-oxobutanoate hydroxymethyltransferase [Acinetobacter guillouiae]MCU4491318.1 3-methyl-2-oxobutanoate hydroxymethyltransferase [Acinetobacter guillouiae]
MQQVTLQTLKQMKENGEKIAVLTCYDSTFSKISNQAGIDALLVGDTLGMVLQGNDSTLPVTIEHMAYHTACVKKGNNRAFIISDLPFMTYACPEQALKNAGLLMRAGSHMVKLEGDIWLSETIRRLTENGVPVCAHIGLTPQAVNVLGGFKVQGRTEKQAKKLLESAKRLEESGAAMLLLECVPSKLAEKITKAVDIPVIGIGAGVETDAQVLVLHDMLGLNEKTAKFVCNFMEGQSSVQDAIKAYVRAVKDGSFPSQKHQYI